MQTIECPICEKETNYLVSSCIHCENCGHFFKIDESSTKEEINLQDIKIDKNKYFKDYFKIFFTCIVVIVLGLSFYYIWQLISQDKLSKGVFYTGLLFLISPNYFRIAYKLNDNIFYSIKTLGLLCMIASFLIFTSPMFYLFK